MKVIFLCDTDWQVIVVMVCFPSTPKKSAMTIVCSIFGSIVFAVGAQLSYVNVEPQQARTMACDKLVLYVKKKVWLHRSIRGLKKGSQQLL